MTGQPLPAVHADDEWSPLQAVIVGRAGRSCFPSAPIKMIKATMPSEHIQHFQPKSPFPEELVTKAEAELEQLATILQDKGVKVYRPPKDIDWLAVDGYTGAMPRDGLMSIGETLIEACFAWSCRSREIEIGFKPILDTLSQDPRWAINNSRPAFDTADFMRFGRTIIGQYSHVTNQAGVDYLRQQLPPGYNIEMLEINDPHAMHIDATILPLRDGLLVYNPTKATEASLRRHAVLASWDLHPYPFTPNGPTDPLLYMTSPWLCLNALVLDGKRVIIKASDSRTADWYESLGMQCICCPFKHVNSIRGSFHCATVDLVREQVAI